MTIQPTHLVPFKGNRITLIDADDGPRVSVPQICAILRIDPSTQSRKLSGQMLMRYSHMTVPSERGEQETGTIPLSRLPVWLLSISASKVRPEIRETLIAFQEECAEVLWAYWSGELTREINAARAQSTRLMSLLITRKSAYSALIWAAQHGATDEEMMRNSSRPRWKTAQMLADLRTAGLIGPPRGGQQDLFPDPDAPISMERLMGMADA